VYNNNTPFFETTNLGPGQGPNQEMAKLPFRKWQKLPFWKWQNSPFRKWQNHLAGNGKK
jgi:hypothetical protein